MVAQILSVGEHKIQVNFSCWERVIDGEVFNMVLKGWYGILIGKTRQERQTDVEDTERNPLTSTPNFA